MSEAEARAKIDRLLAEAGWRLPDGTRPDAEVNVRMETTLRDGGESERADYVLQNPAGFPLAVLEAKDAGKSPLEGKEQARGYAETLRARFVILSNGAMHYLWDIKSGNPTPILAMPPQADLLARIEFENRNSRFNAETIAADYIAQTQGDSTPDDRKRFLRDYQIQAAQAVQRAADGGKKRFLLEMATGAGKTLLAAAIIKLFLRTGNARRVLFLVDRLELEEQARKNFDEYLRNDYITVVYKENRGDWSKAHIVVSTVQTLASNQRFLRLFSPTDFDLLIVDEAHRSIGGDGARAVFEHFVGYKLGLTATPKDFLRGASDEDRQARDRRLLRDTYATFGCESGEPTFAYNLPQGVKDGHLVNPLIIDARTKITTDLLSENGIDLVVDQTLDRDVVSVVRPEDGGAGAQEINYRIRDFERKLFSPATNRAICQAFVDNAKTDPISGEIGKTIAYCVSQKHAARVAQTLNQIAAEKFPGKYNSDFAAQVTSNVDGAQEFARQFANNNLNGHTRFLEGYRSSKTRVCVTVGMMTTGYDCSDLLNLCFMRPVFSPSEFVQMKGRGTRRHKFKRRGEKIVEIEKDGFDLFDFFAVVEYFEKDHDYDRKLDLAAALDADGDCDNSAAANGDDSLPPNASIYLRDDSLASQGEISIGEKGLRVDREAVARFTARIREDEAIAAAVRNEEWEKADRLARENHENRPEDFVTPAKIAALHELGRGLDTREVIQWIFGLLPELKNRAALLDEKAREFLAAPKNTALPEDAAYAAFYAFKTYIDDSETREIIKSEQLAKLAANPAMTADEWRALPKETRDGIVAYARDHVRLEIFENPPTA